MLVIYSESKQAQNSEQKILFFLQNKTKKKNNSSNTDGWCFEWHFGRCEYKLHTDNSKVQSFVYNNSNWLDLYIAWINRLVNSQNKWFDLKVCAKHSFKMLPGLDVLMRKRQQEALLRNELTERGLKISSNASKMRAIKNV